MLGKLRIGDTVTTYLFEDGCCTKEDHTIEKVEYRCPSNDGISDYWVTFSDGRGVWATEIDEYEWKIYLASDGYAETFEGFDLG